MTTNVSPAATRMLTGFPRKSFCATPDAEWSVRRAERSPASCSRKEDPGGDGDGRDRRADQQGPVAPKGASFLPFDEKENLDPVSGRILGASHVVGGAPVVETRSSRAARKPFGLLMQKPANAGNLPAEDGCAPATKRRAVVVQVAPRSTGLKFR